MSEKSGAWKKRKKKKDRRQHENEEEKSYCNDNKRQTICNRLKHKTMNINVTKKEENEDEEVEGNE